MGIYSPNAGQKEALVGTSGTPSSTNRYVTEDDPGISAILSGGVTAAIVTKSANYTATTSDYAILCDAALGGFTITLPPAVSANKTVIVVKKIDASGNAVTIDADGSETIDGDLTQIITAPWTALSLHCNGSAWYLLP